MERLKRPPGMRAEPMQSACGSCSRPGRPWRRGGCVFVVSDYERTFAHHPRCRIFQPLEAAVEAIMAGAQGERLRLARR